MSEIKLTLDSDQAVAYKDVQAEIKEQEEKDAVAIKLDETILSDEEKKMVDDFAQQIDITNSNQVLTYGAAAQKKISSFSETALEKVRTKDLGQIGDDIADLIGELKGFSVEEKPKGFLGLFKKAGNKITAIKSKYSKVETSVNQITSTLEDHQVQLMKDIAMLDLMYDNNLTYFKELSLYIIAGKKKLEEVRNTTVAEMLKKAEESGLPEDAQAANDMIALCDNFEKKLYDLELTRMVSIQMGPQIRLVQNNDKLMAEKIQSTIVNTIPLWKSQMVLALGIAHSQEAMEAQREVTNMTNDLLKKNAEMLKTGTVEIAKESNRGIVDIETLKSTNEALISTLDEVMVIQKEGKEKRIAAEAELGRLKANFAKNFLK